MIVMTFALLFQVRGASGALGAGSTCTHQLVQALVETVTPSSCCARNDAGQQPARDGGETPRDCCNGGMTSAHCLLTVVPAVGRLEVHAACISHQTLILPRCDGTLSMPSQPLLRPPILS